FPINLWPNAVQAYHRWIHDAVRNNMPYDQFARELLTSSGSNFRVAPVNFYRAMPKREPEEIARIVALTFMGMRTDHWDRSQLLGMAAFFGGFMNMNYLLAGTVSTNPLLLAIAIFLILAWKTAGWWGIDRWLLPMLGTPWRPGFIFMDEERDSSLESE
ncbi:MAG: hypothetical protein ACERKY_13540, partial [Anaerolineales bacterium]